MSPEQLVTDTLTVLLDLETGALPGDAPLTGLDGWDSVNALRVLVYLEREAGVRLDFERFGAAGTVADLTAVLAAALGAEAAR